jgi:Ca-activated chloride channel family protein
MTVAHPLHLVVALALAAGVLAVVVWILRSRRRATHAYSNLAFLHAVAAPPKWIERSLAGVGAAGVLALATAFAGPRLDLPMPVRDGSVVLCIDTSGSMASNDIAPTRYAAAQAAARAFIASTPPGTRIGIVAFSGSAAQIAPLETDRALLVGSLDQLPPPNDATAIGDALALAIRMLPPKGHRVIVLITDGVNNRGVDPLAQAQVLGARGIRLFTIGIGTQTGGVIPGTGEAATIDEDALRSYAQAAGGAYARAGSAGALRDALSRLGQVTAFERRNVDASFGFAVFGGLAILGAALTAFALGRLP